MIATKLVGAIAGIIVGVGAVAKGLDRSPPAVVIEAAPVSPVVQPGGTLLIHYAIDRKRVCETTSIATVYDGANIEYKYEPDSRPAFGPPVVEERVVARVVPPSAVPGPARYRVVLEFRCNWTHNLWPIVEVLPDVPFTIVAP